MTSAAEATVPGLDVSRETLAALLQFEQLVRRWNPAINLVSKTTLPEIWSRHILDSTQIFSLCPPKALVWADFGSGGGFPGIVVAILAAQLKPELRVTLVESDLRKATFLRQAAHALSLPVSVCSARIESLDSLQADVVSARALASLPELLAHADRHLVAGGVAIFPKGARYAEELAEARKSWAFDVDVQQSQSDQDAAILVIRNIHHHD